VAEGGEEEQAAAGANTGAHDVFISYASHDAAVANDVCAALEDQSIKCWIAPRDVTPGAHYASEIVHAIDSAKAVFLILSQDAATSPHVLREIERATSKRHPVVTLRLDQAPLSAEFEYFLNTSQWLDASGGDASRMMPKLVAAVKSVIKAPAATQVAALTSHRTANSASRRSPNRTVLVVASLAGLVLAGFAANRLWMSNRRVASTSAPTVPGSATVFAPIAPIIPAKSVAVLPFVDLSEKKDQEYFADGVAEEILNLLAKVPDLKVIGRTSSFRYRDKTDDLRRIGADLSAAYVVEGSVRRSGDHVRITAQLISTRDGAHRWSETYDRDVKDILKVQAEIAANLVRGLQLEVAPSLLSQWGASTQSSDAYDLYLRAQHALYRFDQPGLEEAEADLRRALEVDPLFVPAAETLAVTLFDLAEMGFIAPKAGYEQARQAAHSALKLQPNSGLAHAVVGAVHFQYDWDWLAARQEFKTAEALAPKNPFVLIEAALERMTVGDWNEAMRSLNAVNAADPFDAATYTTLANVYMHLDRPVEAESAARRALEISPTYAGAHGDLAEILLLKGRVDAALTEIKIDNPKESPTPRLVAIYWALHRTKESDALLARFAALPDAEANPSWMAGAYAYRGEKDKALDLLEQAYARRESDLWSIKIDLLLRGLDHDPRYNALLRKMNSLE